MPYSYKTENPILPRNGWSLYKIFWQSQTISPSVFEEHSSADKSWLSSTILYNKTLKSVDDPFGWNKAANIPPKTTNLLRRALDISSKTSEPL
jgi:hypothetical protein